jgi:hypothetical protein
VKGQWTISLEATKGADKKEFEAQVCNSTAVGAPCNQPLLSAQHRDKVHIVAKLASPQIKTNGGLKPTTVTIKLCFSKPFTKDRPWRKAADVIDKDKACPQTIAKLPVGAGLTSYEGTFSIPKAMPRATWYAQVMVTCMNGTAPVVCQYDNTANAAYVATEIIDSTPPAMKVAVGICSAIAPAFLIAFFLKENVLKKRA